VSLEQRLCNASDLNWNVLRGIGKSAAPHNARHQRRPKAVRCMPLLGQVWG
jgi:hypothetical protein